MIRALVSGMLGLTTLVVLQPSPGTARTVAPAPTVETRATGLMTLAQDDGGGAGGSTVRPKPPAAAPPPARRSAPPPPRAARPVESGVNYDGAWSVVSVGETCSGNSTTAVVITSGRIIGSNVVGQVSGSGSVRAVYTANGITSVSTGRLSGRSGSGRFKQSDGCVGRWSAAKR